MTPCERPRGSTRCCDDLEGLWNHVVVGHGVAFDLAILAARPCPVSRREERGPLHDAARRGAPPGWTDVTLESVAARLGVPVVARHTARGDAVTAGAVMVALLPESRPVGVDRTVADALWLQSRVLL